MVDTKRPSFQIMALDVFLVVVVVSSGYLFPSRSETFFQVCSHFFFYWIFLDFCILFFFNFWTENSLLFCGFPFRVYRE